MEAHVIIDSENDCDTPHNLFLKKGFANYLKSPIGKSQLAQSMAMPIRRSLDYLRHFACSISYSVIVIARRALGSLPIYDRSIDVSAVILNDDLSLVEFIFITSKNFIRVGRDYGVSPVRRSLPYQGIARRDLSKNINRALSTHRVVK
jgi:hypothetical protein